MKIRANLTEASIQKAIDQLKKYRSNFYRAFLAAVEDLCNIAAEECQKAYGDPDITMEVIPTATKLDAGVARFEIVANGDQVGFLEFGAGDLADASHPFAGNAPFEVRPGSWSEDNAQKYSTYGYWWYRKEKYYFITPRRGLFVASEYIKDNLREAIRSSMHK